MINKTLPRALLVSEVSFTQGCRGASRTLLNLFENYPKKHLLILSSEKSDPTIEQDFLYFRRRYIPNRIEQLLSPFWGSINLQLHHFLDVPNKVKIDKFSPDIIIVCPMTAEGLLVGRKLTLFYKIPFLIYFMDDWVATDKTKWLSGSVKKLSKELLEEASGLLMISEQLEETLLKRYQLTSKPSMVVHNSVDISGKKKLITPQSKNGSYKIVYAGSIWPMHYDALAAVAEAVFHLRKDGENIELILHTSEDFWNLNKDRWESWEVVNGSLIPYDKLDSFLRRANLLLVVSSFLPEHEFMTRSSVQTKITDYMAAGRPILSCGPDYSACNQFIKKWDCGIVCETNLLFEIKNLLKIRLELQESDHSYAIKAFNILADNFNKQTISHKLYKFIENISLDHKKSNLSVEI